MGSITITHHKNQHQQRYNSWQSNDSIVQKYCVDRHSNAIAVCAKAGRELLISHLFLFQRYNITSIICVRLSDDTTKHSIVIEV